MRIRLLFLVLLSVSYDALASGEKIYQAYEGASLPVEKVVALKISQNQCGWVKACRRVAIDAVDGKRIANFMGYPRRADEFRFLPGKHKITFVVQIAAAGGYAYLWFVGEEGKTYSTQYETNYYSYRLWIRDDATGLPVGGIQGSSDEPSDSAPGTPNP